MGNIEDMEDTDLSFESTFNITTTCKNYKLCKDYTLDVQNADLVIISGRNEIGKSTLITATKEMISAKKLTPNPLSNGETEGSLLGQLPDKDGNPVTISILIDEAGNYKYTLIDHKGSKITQQAKIREVMGYCTFMTIDEFTRACLTAKGKREIMERLIYRLLSDEDMKVVLETDKKLTTDSELYKRIHTLKEELKSFTIQQETLKLTPDEEAVLKAGVEGVDTVIAEKQKEIAFFDNYDTLKKEYDNKIIANAEKKEQLSQAVVKLEEWKKRKLQEIEDEYNQSLSDISNEATKIIAPTPVEPCAITQEQYNELKEHVDTLIQEKGKMTSIVEKKAKLDTLKSSIAPMQKEMLEKEAEKNKLKDTKLAILSKIDIAGLTFDEQTFYINGFEISDEQVSESTRGLVLIELLCRRELNETPIIFVGNMSVFDKERARQVIAICQKNNKIPYFEKVGDTKEIRVITSIEDL